MGLSRTPSSEDVNSTARLPRATTRIVPRIGILASELGNSCAFFSRRVMTLRAGAIRDGIIRRGRLFEVQTEARDDQE